MTREERETKRRKRVKEPDWNGLKLSVFKSILTTPHTADYLHDELLPKLLQDEAYEHAAVVMDWLRRYYERTASITELLRQGGEGE